MSTHVQISAGPVGGTIGTSGEAPVSPPGPGAFRSFVAGWHDFWFKPADPTVLGLIRICCGLMLLYVHVLQGLQLQELFGADAWLNVETANSLRREMPGLPPPDGWVEPEPVGRPVPGMSWDQVVAYRERWGMDPGVAMTRGQAMFSVWFHLTDPTAMLVLHYAMLVVVGLFTLGVGTRVTSVLAWVTALSYVHRATLATFGMDTMLALLLLYLMFSPCGAALSVDRLIARYRVMRRALDRHKPVPALLRPAPRPSANFALRLLQVHFCIIYFASGASKLQGAAWWNGTALWQTTMNYEFAGPRSEAATAALRSLTQHRWVWELAMNAGALFTLALELGLPFLVWFPRLRWPVVTAAVMLHVGIAMMMGGLGTFSLLMLTILLSFVPAQAVHALLARLGRGSARLWLAFNSRQPNQVRAAALAHAFDFWGQLRDVDFATAQRPADAPGVAPAAGLQLVGDDGEAVTGYPLWERLARSLRGLWPLALLSWLPGVARAGRALAPAGGATAGQDAHEPVGAGRS